MRISDWSSDVCSSDLVLGVVHRQPLADIVEGDPDLPVLLLDCRVRLLQLDFHALPVGDVADRADDPFHPTIRAATAYRAIEHPPPAPVAVPHPVFGRDEVVPAPAMGTQSQTVPLEFGRASWRYSVGQYGLV